MSNSLKLDFQLMLKDKRYPPHFKCWWVFWIHMVYDYTPSMIWLLLPGNSHFMENNKCFVKSGQQSVLWSFTLNNFDDDKNPRKVPKACHFNLTHKFCRIIYCFIFFSSACQSAGDRVINWLDRIIMRIIQFCFNPPFLILLFLDFPVRSFVGRNNMMEYKVKM